MKHKHYEMIVAKAENMELVVLAKTGCDKVSGEPIKWSVIHTGEFAWLSDERRDVFLCLSQHKDACLHWLNGGLVRSANTDARDGAINPYKGRWSPDCYFMNELHVMEIIRKEKRWIASFPWCGKMDYVVPCHFESHKELCNFVANEYGARDKMQIIEIEVEV